MPIFHRRVIQKILDENREFLPAEQIAEHVKKLNSQDNTSVAAVWEAVILNVLSKIGQVTYEKEFEGSRRPDIFFESSNIHPFVADITAISDEYYENENPINYFRKCLNIFFNKAGLTTKGISFDVGNEMIGDYGDKKIKLTLPDKKDIPAFIKREFFVIRKAIKSNPNQAFNTTIKIENTIFSISYNPQSKYSTQSYAAYTTPYSLKRNPVYNRLKKKAEQLRNSKYEGIMGVFICDGECDSLNNDSYCVDKFSQADVIQEAFRVNTTLSFVVVLSPEEKHNIWGLRTTKYIKGLCYSNPKAKFPVTQDLFQELYKMEAYFPVPESMPVNAKTYMKSRKHKGLPHYGGFTMSQNEIKISSRMITELLAGVLDFEKFDIDHKQMTNDNKKEVKAFFLRQFKQGKMIDNISVEKCHDKDDDWIKFKYGLCDAAVSEYK